jgi:hypothetical protein
MKAFQGLVAALEIVLLAPAALFMSAVFVQGAFERPQNAEALVRWYAGQMWTLWLLLILLPLAALIAGATTLLRRESLDVLRAHFATFVSAAVTLASAAILAIVALHMAAN